MGLDPKYLHIFDNNEFGEPIFQDLSEYSLAYMWVSILTPYIYLATVLGLTFICGWNMGSLAVTRWLMTVFMSMVLVIVSDVFQSWMIKAYWPMLVYCKITTLQSVLKRRCQFLLRRRQGTIHTFSALVQHFNPVCRAARQVPYLFISRILLLLNDYKIRSHLGCASKNRANTIGMELYIKLCRQSMEG